MYLALYRKWRSETFDDVVGQAVITTTLKHQVAEKKTAHAYLLCGPRGTGKTSCAKILAKGINCKNPQNGNPCLLCSHCVGIQNGSILDVTEMDAASNNGVDDVRMLREEALYTPTTCDFRVYIIDEVHMLSIAAFNALLKIMEEPPAHVKFILATTEVHKLPATIVSRCQRFDFLRIDSGEIQKRLLLIAEDEPFSLTEGAAQIIARLADGGMRDALSILDQCAAFTDCIDEQTVRSVSGLVSREFLFDLMDAIIEKSTAIALTCVDSLYQNAKDPTRLLVELLEHLRNLMLKKSESAEWLLRCLPEEVERLDTQARRVTLPFLLWAIAEVGQCLDFIAKGYDKRLTVERCLVVLCDPPNIEQAQMTATLVQRIVALEQQLLTLRSGESLAPVVKTAATTAPPVSPVEKSSPEEPVVATAVPIATTSDGEQQTLALAQWGEILKEIAVQNPALSGLLVESAAFVAGDSLFIASKNALLGDLIKQEGFLSTLRSAIYQKTNQSYKIRIKRPKRQHPVAHPIEALLQKATKQGVKVINNNEGV